MAALATVTIDRSEMPGSLTDLVIDSEGFSTYYIDEQGLGRPGLTSREKVAAASDYINGQLRTAIVYEDTQINLVVRVQASSSAALDTAVTALVDALKQFVYTVTVVVDGVTKVWTTYSASSIQSTDALIAVERVMSFHEDLSISIPAYPVSA